MERIKGHLKFAVIMAIYYYYRISTAISRPSKPVLSFFFWKNEKELIERNTTMFIIYFVLLVNFVLFGVKWMLITSAIIIAFIGIMTIYQLIKMWRNDRKK